MSKVEEASGCRKAMLRSYGLALMAGSSLTFSVVSLLVSLLVGNPNNFPVYQVVAIRFFMQWGCAALTLMYQRKAPCFEYRNLQPMIARAFFGIISMVTFYMALEHFPMASASVIRFTSPAMVVVLARLLYKEPFGWTEGISTVVSTIGVVFVAQPSFIFGSHQTESSSSTVGGGSASSSTQTGIAIGLAFCAAVAAAFAFLGIRRVNRVPPFVTTFVFSLAGFLTISPIAFIYGNMKWPNSFSQTVLLFSPGVVGYVGQFFMCRSLQLEAAGPATMMRYLDVAFAYIFQIWIEKRGVDWISPVGALLVVSGAGIIAVQRWCCPRPGDVQHDASKGTPPSARKKVPSREIALSPSFRNGNDIGNPLLNDDDDMERGWN